MTPDPMTHLHLKIVTEDIIEEDQYEFAVARPCDDKTEPGKCHMSVSRRSAAQIRTLLQKRQHERSELRGALMERMAQQDVPVEGHHNLRITEATPDDTFQDADLPGGGRVIGLMREDLDERWYAKNAKTALKGTGEPQEPESSAGRRARTSPKRRGRDRRRRPRK